MSAPAIVVVPARDEQERIGACLRALAAQHPAPEVILVLDGCADATAEVAGATAAACGLELELVPGPGRGVGFARGAGMAAAAERLRARGGGIIASTDADTVVEPGWLAAIEDAVAAGAAAVGGPILLDPHEAAALPESVLAARRDEATARLAAVRLRTPTAEHHQFSGASLALTLEAYEAVGGLPPVAALEDEALERALHAAGLRVAYAAGATVITSARTGGRADCGLAQVLRVERWRAREAARRAASDSRRVDGGDPLAGVRVLRAGEVGREALRAATGADELVLVLGPGVTAAEAAGLARTLRDDGSLMLARAAEPHPDPVAELVVRPALNLHAPELAALASPLTRTWAARGRALAPLSLPLGHAVDLAVLLDLWRTHGLDAIAELPLAAPPVDERADPPLAAYELLSLIADRTGTLTARTSAFRDARGTRRAMLEEAAGRVPV